MATAGKQSLGRGAAEQERSLGGRHGQRARRILGVSKPKLANILMFIIKRYLYAMLMCWALVVACTVARAADVLHVSYATFDAALDVGPSLVVLVHGERAPRVLTCRDEASGQCSSICSNGRECTGVISYLMHSSRVHCGI